MSSPSHWRQIRRLALIGRTQEVRSLLESILADDPENEQAAAELARLDAGEPLRCAETKKERGAREAKEARHSLSLILGKNKPGDDLSAAPTVSLRSLRRSIRASVATLKRQHAPAPPGTSALLRKIERELRNRRSRFSYWARRLLVAFSVVLLLVGGATFLLRERAVSLAHRLEDAIETKEWEHVRALLSAVDTGINRLLLPSVESLSDRTRAWQQQILNSHRDLSYRMDVYKRINAISSLSLEERGSFLRSIRKLPMPFSGQLLEQWNALCQPERDALDRQRNEFVARCVRARQVLPLTGDPVEDRSLLRTRREELSKICEEFDDAKEAFDLDPNLIFPLREDMKSTLSSLHDLDGLIRTTDLLGTARNYEEHLRAAKDFAPQQHRPSLAAAETIRRLPSPASMADMLRSARHGLSFPLPPHVSDALLKGSPTFSQAAPAKQLHLHLMEDIFSSATLRRPIYAVSTWDGKVFYSEKAPKTDTDGNVQVELSTLDPSVSSPTTIEIKSFAYAGTRVINAVPILSAVRIERSTFFLRANVPQMLGTLTSSELADSPSLARAYIYGTLLEVLHHQPNHEDFFFLFSPTLKEDAADFQALCGDVNFPLSVTCWLSHSPRAPQAEDAFARWFRTHANRHYFEEARHNFSAILKEPMGYVGFVDCSAIPRFKDAPPKNGRTLRYFSGGLLVASPSGSPPENPDLFSPIFAD